MRHIKLTLLLAAIVCVKTLSAQYYSWGADAPMKWSRMKGDKVQVLYPDTASMIARRALHYINSVQGDISYGFDHPALDIPFVIHPENFASNGLVMWMPKRVEFISSPATESYSMLWHKQLVAHEYRHAVQYNNLNQHFVKALSYILGQQGSAVGLVFMPLFALEGDAVFIETQMSSYGRGLQPSFSMEYRALGDALFSKRKIDKWFCGSFRTNIPDHYHLGYQFMSYTYEKYGENVWNKAVKYTTRRPIKAFNASAGLIKCYDTTIKKTTIETFKELYKIWAPLSEVPNTTEIISTIDSTNYTTYSHPMSIGGGEVLSLKSSYSKTPRFVITNNNLEERHIAKIGSLSTRPSYSNGRVWWTEYRRSLLFDEKVNSQLCYMDIESGRTKRVKGINKALYAEATGDNCIAYVEYFPSGHYRVVEREGERTIKELKVEFPTEIHGLAWDDKSKKLYIIATDDSGMWLGVEQGDGFTPLHEGRYITLSNLRAKGGVLYFGSIASGLDELHSYNIESGEETQITRSTYGSFQPSTPKDGYIYATTYDRYGYHLSRQCEEKVVGRITPGRIPTNLVNPERKSLGLINLDSVKFESSDSILLQEQSPERRFRKGAHMIKPHSWAPVRFNPFTILEEQSLDIGWGATLISQNLLSSCEGYLSYGYDRGQGSVISSAMTYTGLGVQLSAGVTYGGDRLIYKYDNSTPAPIIKRNNYFSASATASLPLYFQRGYLTHQLSLWSGYNYSNSYVEQLDRGGEYNIGLHKLSLGAGFGTYARSAYRDVQTPLGYYISADYTLNPTNGDFSPLLSTYAKVYLPGILPHNSITLAANYQTNIGDGYCYKSSYIIPHGYLSSDVLNNNYIASSAKYELPVWYPEGGIGGALYFKRIRLNIEGEYAQYDISSGGVMRLYSYGGGVSIDFNLMRLPASGTMALDFSMYNSRHRGLNYAVGLSMPF